MPWIVQIFVFFLPVCLFFLSLFLPPKLCYAAGHIMAGCKWRWCCFYTPNASSQWWSVQSEGSTEAAHFIKCDIELLYIVSGPSVTSACASVPLTMTFRSSVRHQLVMEINQHWG